jgi:hypothetical protein
MIGILPQVDSPSRATRRGTCRKRSIVGAVEYIACQCPFQKHNSVGISNEATFPGISNLVHGWCGVAENELGWNRIAFYRPVDDYLGSKIQSSVSVLVDCYVALLRLLDARHSPDDYQIG